MTPKYWQEAGKRGADAEGPFPGQNVMFFLAAISFQKLTNTTLAFTQMDRS